MELQQEHACIGQGTRATVLFHEPTYDSAMIRLDPGAELSETNSTNLDMLYFVCESEDNQVEFDLATAESCYRVSRGGEVRVPAGATYSLRNRSTEEKARLLAVVPRLPAA
uniref:Mif2/CENP-C cupin domain-containing protein n=1 Tax=Alexandrium monilatum TaxID=311494 RepID=A0A7S4UHH7_9DINO|mmetsp:Transcript_59837/g.185572  ORF Transcript_59837/g.185572 Transcript_59837/m.185572 type:complete len:111 (+) Transcript_59837:354-686(+)